MQQYPELNLNYGLQLQERMSIGSELGAAWTLAGQAYCKTNVLPALDGGF